MPVSAICRKRRIRERDKMAYIKLFDVRLVFLFFTALITACSPTQNEPPKIAESQRQVLDQAKTLNDTVIQQADEQKKKIDAETQ